MANTSFFVCCVVCVVIVALAWSATASADSVSHEESFALFNAWAVKYNRAYSTEEEKQLRYEAFMDSLKFVQQHNERLARGEVEFTVGLNKFADWTREEYVAFVRGYKPKAKPRRDFVPEVHGSLPASVDWRTKNCVTPVLNQGQCGSSWAFSAIVSLEGARALASKQLETLSAQQLSDCVTQDQGCNGGEMTDAFAYAIQYGIENAGSYPYCGDTCNGTCHYDPSKVIAGFASYADVPSGNETALQVAMATFPGIATAIDASQTSFQLYTGGVYSDPNCSSVNIDHGIGAVGYGSLSGSNYWLLKNTWGADWGDQGYVLVARNKKNMCGVATSASYILI